MTSLPEGNAKTFIDVKVIDSQVLETSKILFDLEEEIKPNKGNSPDFKFSIPQYTEPLPLNLDNIHLAMSWRAIKISRRTLGKYVQAIKLAAIKLEDIISQESKVACFISKSAGRWSNPQYFNNIEKAQKVIYRIQYLINRLPWTDYQNKEVAKSGKNPSPMVFYLCFKIDQIVNQVGRKGKGKGKGKVDSLYKSLPGYIFNAVTNLDCNLFGTDDDPSCFKEYESFLEDYKILGLDGSEDLFNTQVRREKVKSKPAKPSAQISLPEFSTRKELRELMGISQNTLKILERAAILLASHFTTAKGFGANFGKDDFQGKGKKLSRSMCWLINLMNQLRSQCPKTITRYSITSAWAREFIENDFLDLDIKIVSNEGGTLVFDLGFTSAALIAKFENTLDLAFLKGELVSDRDQWIANTTFK